MKVYKKTFLGAAGFSLIEVVLAMGIFLVTVLALVGLLGPTLQSVDDVEKTDEVSSVVNTVNAFLQNAPGIATATDTKFNVIYDAVATNDYAQLFVFRAFRDDTSTDIVLKVGFLAGEETVGSGGTDATVSVVEFENAAGPIYRVVLTPSSVIPLQYHQNTVSTPDGVVPSRDTSTNTYKLLGTVKNDVSLYNEGYFAMEVRIYAENPGPAFNPANIPPDYSAALTLTALADLEPIFTYNTAIVR